MRKILVALFILILGIVVSPHIYAQRIAECDACGFCNGKAKPDNWDDCKACLYPQITPVDGLETLKVVTTPMVDPQNPNKIIVNVPVPPAKGKYFTQLGCVDTSLSSFADPAASGGVLNFILTRLIFPSTGILAFGALLYGAYILMMAQGAQMEVARGKRYITGAVVGLIFTFGVILIVNVVGVKLLRIPGLGESNEIVVEAAGSVAWNDTNKENLRYPTMNVYVGDTLVKTFPGATGNIQQPKQNPTNFPGAFVNYSVLADITSGQTIRIEFTNDFCPAGCTSTESPLGDVNLFIKDTISIDGENCINPRYIIRDELANGVNKFYPPTNVVNEEYKVFNMFYNGFIVCTAP